MFILRRHEGSFHLTSHLASTARRRGWPDMERRPEGLYQADVRADLFSDTSSIYAFHVLQVDG